MVSYAYNNRGLKSAQAGRYGPLTSYGYDAVGRLSSMAHDVAGSANDTSYAFGHNPAGQMTSRTLSNDAYVWTGAYNVSRAYAVNGLNQYLSAGSATFGYDANGNLTSDGSNAYVYDIENRLVSASGATSASLRYDPLGRLYETSGASGTTRFLYDGDELVAEYNGSGTMLRRYAHGSNIDDPVVWYEGSSIGPARWLHADHQGSVVAITDSTGAAIAINRYDEWGIPAATNMGRFQYTGQAWIPELGLYHYKARIYSPTLGRFLQTDPIGYDDQINLYAYVSNDPVNNTDPDGQAAETAWDVANVIMGAKSAYDNFSEGEIGAGIVDSVGVVIDAAATVTPFVPGGAGALIKSARYADDAADAAKTLRKSTEVGTRVRTPDTHRSQFRPLPKGQGAVDRRSGLVWQKSKTNHSRDPRVEYKVRIKKGEPPRKKKKMTVTRSDCRLYKKEKC